MWIRLVPLAVASLALGAVVVPAYAEVSVQKECGAEYQAAKAAGSLSGQTWQQFRQDCLARHAAPTAAAAPATTPAPASAAAPAPAPTAATPPAPAAPAAAPAESHVSVQKECGAEYQAAKTAGSLSGQTWQQFLQACRARHAPPAAAAAPTAAPAAAPAAPAPVAAPAAAPAAPAKPVAEAPAGAATTKAGKPVSPGMQAFIEREKQCGAEWRANQAAIKKANPKATWPSYLSECNKRLKTPGR